MATIQSKVVQLLQDSPVVKKLAKEVYGDIEKAAEYLGDKFAGKKDIRAVDLASELTAQKKIKELDISPEEAEAFETFARKEGLPVERGGLPAVKGRPSKRKLITPELIEAGPSSLEKPGLLKAGREDIIELPGKVDEGIEPRAKIVSEREGLPKREAQKLLPEGRPDAIPMPGRVDDGIEPQAKILSRREDGVRAREEQPSSPVALIDKIQKGKRGVSVGTALGAAGLGAMATADSRQESDDMFNRADDLDLDYIPSSRITGEKEEPKPEPVEDITVTPEVKKEPVKSKTLKEAVGSAAPDKKPDVPGETDTVSEEKPKELTLADRIRGIEGKRAEAKALREEQRKRADWGELATTIGRALTQIGAAQQGLRTGVDMSNVLGPALTDWDKKRDRIDNDYKQEIAELSAEQREITRLAEREEDKAARKEYQDKQVELEREKLKAQEEREKIKQAGKLAADNLKALATKNTAALKAQTKKTNDALKDSERRFQNLRELDGLIASDAKSDKIKQKAVEIFGREAVSEEGLIWGTNIKNVKGIQEIVKGELESTQSALDSYKKQLDMLQSGGAPAPTPTQPEAPAAPTEKRQDVQEYANQYFGGDYNKAFQFLKGRGDI